MEKKNSDIEDKNLEMSQVEDRESRVYIKKNFMRSI